MAGELAIGLERNMPVGFDDKMVGLEILDIGEFGQGAEEQATEITRHREIVHVLKDANVEQSILQVGLREQGKRTSIKPTVADQDKGAFNGGLTFAEITQPWRFFRRDLCGREKVAERAENMLDVAAIAFNDLRIDADAGHLHEKMAIGTC